jgi:phospholipid/cholesterol/gamma-HCH transport system permease protein
MGDTELHFEVDKKSGCVLIQGPVDIRHFAQVKDRLERLQSSNESKLVIDVSGITQLDTAGAFLLQHMVGWNGADAPELRQVRPEHKALFDLAAKTQVKQLKQRKPLSSPVYAVTQLGKASAEAWHSAIGITAFTGQAALALAGIVRHPSRLRLISVSHQMEVIGIHALPIIALISCVISIVIAYQGQVQLKPLGAGQYTVNLIAISVLREMGVLLTAIMVAARSGSAFAAEIGTMKVRQELDALRTMGFNPFELLVLPRIIAMLITLPLLTFFADFMGLLGGAIMSGSLLDISLLQYLEQVRHSATWKDFLAGMIKSPVFAFIIAVVGCMHGMHVSGSSESVGKETTASVVQAIFLILMLDGLFSVYFEKVGL